MNSSRAPWPGLAVVKLGGSLLTLHSEGRPALDLGLLDRLGAELAGLRRPLLVLHGTGHFGKPPARQHGYLDGRLPAARARVVAQVTAELQALEHAVGDSLLGSGLPVFRLPAAALLGASAGDCRLTRLNEVQGLLSRGLVPLIGGGFVLDEPGFAVCSSDRIATELAVALGARTVVLATQAAGVCRNPADPSTVMPTLADIGHAGLDLADPALADVSGGMRRKVEECLAAARAGVRSFIIDGRRSGNIAATLAGQPLSGTELLCTAPRVGAPACAG